MDKKILFLCRGNVSRSQFAEHYFNMKHGANKSISAGTRVRDKNGNSMVGQKIHELGQVSENSIHVARQFSVDISNAERKQLTEEMLENVDTIVCILEEETYTNLEKVPGKNYIYWNIEDPKGKTADETLRIFQDIKTRIDSL